MQVTKRDGSTEAYEGLKIARAMQKALREVGDPAAESADALDRLLARAEAAIGACGSTDVESIQDIVERTLMESGHFDAAKAYILYRQLDKLVESGVVRKFVIDGKTGACYQYIENEHECREHFHLKCISCGKLIHLNCDHLMSINKHIEEHHGFIIDPSQTVFYGRCADCSAGVSETDEQV